MPYNCQFVEHKSINKRNRIMEGTELMELATYCQNRFREEHRVTNERYVGTLFVAISKENEVTTSTTPHILKNAEQCILIHEWSALAYTNWYSWYCVEYINKEGCAYTKRFDDDFTIHTVVSGSYSNQVLRLCYNDKELYSCQPPWERQIAKIWKLYLKLKEIESSKEKKLVAELFCKDETILELKKENESYIFANKLLEQERNQYKALLEEIKKMVESKNV